MKLAYLVMGMVLLVPTAASAYKTTRDCEIEENIDKRIRACTAFIKTHPNSGWAHFHRGHAYHLLGKNARALSDYDAAKLKTPTDGVLAIYHALAIIDLRKANDAALQEINMALAVQNPRLDAKGMRLGYYARGKAYVGKREYAKAIADFTQALSLDPRFSDGYIARAEVYEKIGKKKKAQEDRESNYRLNPILRIGPAIGG